MSLGNDRPSSCHAIIREVLRRHFHSGSSSERGNIEIPFHIGEKRLIEHLDSHILLGTELCTQEPWCICYDAHQLLLVTLMSGP